MAANFSSPGPKGGVVHGLEGSNISIWAFDFDGVLCDSARETGLAGWKTCAKLFQHSADDAAVQSLLDKFVQVRPILETGWEAVIMMHLLHTGCHVADMLTQFQPTMKAAALQKHSLTEDDVKAAFKTTRSEWIAGDTADWLTRHGFYHQAVSAVQELAAAAAADANIKVYIITTKGKEFALELLKAANVRIPEERVFGLGSGRKGQVLKGIILDHVGRASRCVFVEDRIATLVEVDAQRDDVGAEKLSLILADWGYNTEQQRGTCTASPSMTLVDQAALCKMVQTPDLHNAVHVGTLFK